MNVAIFGGTFDPVHRGHLAVARAAQRAYKLGRIYFVPADIPPHKQRQPITPFCHRYAMLALALRGEPSFVASLMESGLRASGARPQARRPNYSIDTVRRFRALLPKHDRLFFIIGMDAFRDIGTWHKPAELMKEVELIVVNRPGFRLPSFGVRIPGLAKGGVSRGVQRVHLLAEVAESVSSTQVREVAASGRATKGLLDEAVIEYIRKQNLYSGNEY